MFGKPVKSDAIVIWVCVLLTAACLLLWGGWEAHREGHEIPFPESTLRSLNSTMTTNDVLQTLGAAYLESRHTNEKNEVLWMYIYKKPKNYPTVYVHFTLDGHFKSYGID